MCVDAQLCQHAACKPMQCHPQRGQGTHCLLLPSTLLAEKWEGPSISTAICTHKTHALIICSLCFWTQCWGKALQGQQSSYMYVPA